MTHSPSGSPPYPQDTRRRTLVLVGELDGITKRWPVDGAGSRLGSSRKADITLNAPGISRLHARIYPAALSQEDAGSSSAFFIEDLQSKNGTRVDGRKIDQPVPLNPGQTLKLGTLSLSLELTDSDDVEVGLDLGTDFDLPTAAGSQVETERGLVTAQQTLTGTKTPGLAGFLVALAEAFASHPGSAPGDPVPYLSELLEKVDAQGALLLETSSKTWPRGRSESEGSPWVVLASLGHWPNGLPDLYQMTEEAQSAETSVHRRAGDLAWTFVPYADGGGSALVLLKPAARDLGLDLPIRLTLSWIAHDRNRRWAKKDPRESAQPLLLWPEDHVTSRSPTMQNLYAQLRSVVGHDVPVLILGETGVGKEHIAHLLHRSSGRKGPLVAVNCAAIPKDLLESELFGIVKGAATGVNTRKGKFEAAQGGTLFLDEIGDLPHDLQAKLLRVLQEKVVQPLGGAPVQLDVHIVSATHGNLRRQIQDGEFRQDLFYRLAGFEAVLPALRQRPEDLGPLIQHFARRTCDETGKRIRGFSAKVFRLLQAYPWPGNIRELEHEIRRVVLLCPAGEVVDSSMLSQALLHPANIDPSTTPNATTASAHTRSTHTGADSTALTSSDAPTGGRPLDQSTSLPADLQLEPALQDLERRMILEALRLTAGNQTKAAKRLSISRNGLIHRLKKLEIDSDAFRPE